MPDEICATRSFRVLLFTGIASLPYVHTQMSGADDRCTAASLGLKLRTDCHVIEGELRQAGLAYFHFTAGTLQLHSRLKSHRCDGKAYCSVTTEVMQGTEIIVTHLKGLAVTPRGIFPLLYPFSTPL